jgi:phospholipid/cholesterol/gamma-HCH transport system permease protein
MPPPAPRDGGEDTTAIERRADGVVVIHLRGDVAIPTARAISGQLRAIVRRKDVRGVVLDFAAARRLDSAGVALVSLAERTLTRDGKTFRLENLDERHRAALELVDRDDYRPIERVEPPPVLERFGATILAGADGIRAAARLVAETGRELGRVIARRARFPAGALAEQAVKMGNDAIFIVALMSFLLGTSIAFQTAVQLQKLGAGIYVADLIGVTFVREFGPLITAIILTGRTGAAIAAELGTMRVRSEIDALAAMGVSPVRYLIAPRITAITLVQPALSLMAMFVGIAGGMLVASIQLDLAPQAFWNRTVLRLELWDFAHGLGKALAFAWVIGFTGSVMGLRARADASSVGSVTTRTVVTSVFLVILVDAIFSTVASLMETST